MADANEAGEGGGAFAETHRELLKDGGIQFEFENRELPDPPEVNQTLAELIAALAPFFTYIFWGGVFLLAAWIVYAIATELVRRMPQRRAEQREDAPPPVPSFRPAAARARALLEEADRLAREGRYGEAVRVLLHRSIEDMEEAHPSTIAPSMTSREISTLEFLSEHGRHTFVRIAQAVEASLFAGRPLTADQFADCRKAYETFAFEAPAI